MNTEKNPVVERRQGPDLWVKFLKAAAILVWLAMLVILLIIDQAKPEFENFFSRLFNVTLRQDWDTDILAYAFYLSVLMLIFSIFTLLVNRKRHRRKSDRYSRSVIIMIFFSTAVILFYFIKTYL
ncbi:hypothetical protein [Desulforamulus ruminis]|uniref:Uncharacterized protein n=1 Tax=Desulforamulus ruminis (strain ATCC 23193 / DSM 2154 / NCIMB 8452 / DL) TaxID=696281 RepID=F6DLN9_DESRL|nr:hypothetical protein [Desulforamulus ruminis]AEG61681.1 hypothetical protein Desru_3478 [Desulforamulus ruminis DSM 2154]